MPPRKKKLPLPPSHQRLLQLLPLCHLRRLPKHVASVARASTPLKMKHCFVLVLVSNGLIATVQESA